MNKILALSLMLLCSVCFAETKIFYADGPSDKKRVALTFDDGPGGATEKVLEILKEKNVKATFFMLGCQVDTKPKKAKAVADAGHEIANHTYNHVNFYAYKTSDKAAKMENELMKADSSIQKATGFKPFLVRFPHGYSRADVKEIVKKNKYYLINWTFGCDWEKFSAEEMQKKYIAAIRPGAIFLMHDGNNGVKLTAFLGNFIDALKTQGYEIVTVSELLNLQAKQK